MIKKPPIQLPSMLSVNDVISELMNKDPMHFVENMRTVKGDKFRIINTGRDYLKGVYDYIAFEAPKPTGKPVVVVKGRQVEFTETMLNLCLYYLYHMKNITILYAFPTGDQVRRFSSDRFDGAIRESQNETLKKLYLPGGKQNVHHKQFKGNTQIFMYSAWGQADTLRGITCDVLIKDEVQDWTTAGVQNTQEAMSQSKYKIDLAIGTPKSEATYYYKIWEDSDKRYYFVRCVGCAELFRITMQNCVKLTLIQCPKCSHVQEKRDAIKKGEWKPTAKDPEKTAYVGFHLSQLMHPNITIEDILRKQKDYGERRFKNEVLGEFTGSMDRTLSPQDIIDIIEQEKWNTSEFHYPPSMNPPEHTVMGIDWGGHSEERQRGSYSAVVIVKPINYAKYQIVFTKKLMSSDYKAQVDEIISLAIKFNCQQIVADQGFGHVQIQMLQKELGTNRVAACMYQSNLKAQYKYDSDTNMASVDRDYALEELLLEIKNKQWIIPLKSSSQFAADPEEAESDEYEWLIHHICNIEIVDVIRGGNPRKSFQKTNRPCDGLHALNYARLALIIKGHIIKQQSMISLNTGFTRPLLARFDRRLR